VLGFVLAGIERVGCAEGVGVWRFVKIDPERNERRWYVVAWGPTLFGTWSVTRAWGRLGTNWSQRRVEEFPSEEEACAEVDVQAERRERRGYMVTSDGVGFDFCAGLYYTDDGARQVQSLAACTEPEAMSKAVGPPWREAYLPHARPPSRLGGTAL
jgi:predicted DNA-binding WGR domain protein